MQGCVTHLKIILVSVLQKNKTDKRVIDYKQLAYMIVNAGKCQDFQGVLASWTPRRASGVFLP